MKEIQLKQLFACWALLFFSSIPLCASAFADELFCTDPYQAICSNIKTHRNTRLKSVNALVLQAQEKELSDFLKKYHLPQMNPAVHHSSEYRFKETFFEQHSSEIMAADDRIAKQLKKIAGPAFDDFVHSQEPILEKNLTSAIDASPLPSEKKKLFKSYLRGENFTFSRDSLLCGHQGENLLAQADDLPQNRETGHQAISVCPGFYLFHPQDETPTDRLAISFMVMSHEMAHIMSSYWEPKIYKRFNSCIQKNFTSELVEEYIAALQKESGQALGSKDLKEINRRKKEVVAAHFEEISADYWAKEALIQYFNTEGQALSRKQKLKFLQNAYGNFCSTPDRGTHPSGVFRIELMGNDPSIRQALECVQPTAKKSCGLNGESP